MDSIKFKAKGHSVEFSKRTLTIDGEVYSYTGISQVKHSSAYKAYLFRYKGEWVKLFYDEPHASVVAALFKRINLMNAKRAAQARATQSIDTAAIAAALAASEEPEAKAEEPAAKAEKPVEKPKVEPKPAPAAKPEPAPAAKPEPAPAAEPEPAPAAEPEPLPIPAVEPVLELEPTPEPKAEEPAAEKPAEEPAAEKPAEEPVAEKPAEEPAAEPTEEEAAKAAEAAVKKAKRKKAFIIFAIIIALFIVAGIIYFLTVGTTNDASQGPNVDGTHQYNDIEELIEEMQE